MVALCSEERLIQSHKAGGYCLHPFTQRRSSGFENWLDATALGLIFLASLFLTQELRASLEQQCAQSNQLCVVLKHEQTAKDNLRQELQIEASRCEALLAQERGHMSELQRSLEAERDRARELSEALQHERILTERLSRRPQERPAHQALLQKLRAQEEHVRELEVALEAAQRRALEAEAHVHREEVEREQEVSAAPKTPPETLPGTRERPARGRGRVEQDACEDVRTGAELRPSRADTQPWSRWQRDKETLVSVPVLAPDCPSAWSLQPGGKWRDRKSVV